MNGEIWAFSDDEELAIEMISGSLSLANNDSSNVVGICIGKGARERANTLARFGAGKVYLVEDQSLNMYSADTYVDALSNLAAKESPSVILIGANRRGRELAPRIAARLKAGCASGCSAVRLESGKLMMERVVYSGVALATITSNSPTTVVAVNKRTFTLGNEDESQKADIISVQPELSEARVHHMGFEDRGDRKKILTDSEIVVSVGRGLQKQDDLALIENLATILGAEIGCSRPISSDYGWLPEDSHVGLSGIRISPKLYIAIGISGQIQHLTGIKDSKIIVAVNIDEKAPIFEASDYCVVADLYEFVPVFSDYLKKRLTTA